METVIEITTGYDTLTMTGTDVWGNGWIYDNDTLDAWFKLAPVAVKLNKRPNAHGTYLPDQLFTEEHRTSIVGQYFGATVLDAAQARNRLTALFNDGRPVMITVTDDLGATSRVGLVIEASPEWEPDTHFRFTLTIAAADPRRYGTMRDASTGLATPGSGLVWPLGTNPAAFWDWGTEGATGRTSFTNYGNTSTYPVLLVGEGGSLPEGFVITEIETGRQLTYSRSTSGQIVRLDTRTRRVTINGGDVTGGLTRREWFEVPANTTRTYHLAALGAVVGAPRLEISGADAYL